MKIVYYLPSLYTPGGLERIVTFKANYLAEQLEGYEVYIVTSEQAGQKPHFELSSRVTHIDLGVPFDWPFDQSRVGKLLKYPFRYLRFKQRFTRLLNELKPDITLSTLRRELNFINHLKDGSIKIGEFHVTRHSYGVGSEEGGNPVLRLLRKKWAKSFVKNLGELDKLVILTNEEAGNWPELNNTCVIPNPIITPTTFVSDCTARQVIAAGRYAPQKGFDLLIESWNIVARKHPGWVLKIYGDGSLRTPMQQRIDELGIGESCRLEPTTPDIARKYSESSIFVLSSRFEGFGMVITEAMACGIPAVSFACPCGPRDIIRDRLDGLLVEPENIEQLAEKISYLITNDDIRREMGKQALQRSEQYTPNAVMLHWHKLFNELLKQNKTK